MPTAEAIQHQLSREQLSAATARAVLDQWQMVDPAAVGRNWALLLDKVTAIVQAGQLTAAKMTTAYMRTLLPPADGLSVIIPQALAATAPDGQSVATLMALPISPTNWALSQGESPAAAMARGAHLLDMLTRTVIADTGRQADQIAMVADRRVNGYIRVVETPACARCIVLAGRIYSVTTSFQRHPRCDCTMEPNTDERAAHPVDSKDVFNAMSPEERHKTFGAAGAKAIADGADLSRVVNARRGMTTVEAYGRRVQATTAGTGRRNRQGQRKKAPRLTPESIYANADGRDHAISLLRTHGYIT
jgi:hypothetical protein